MYRWGFGAYSPPPANIAPILQTASASSGVPVNILDALAFQESSYNPNAVSSAGAQGLLQLMPATGKSLGVTNPLDPQQNANAGAQYLQSLYQQYGNWNDALVAYNEGPGNFASQGAFPSSSAYAASILSNAGVSDPSQTITPDSGIDPTASGVDPSSDSTGISTGLDLSSISPVWWAAGGLGFLGLLMAVNR